MIHWGREGGGERSEGERKIEGERRERGRENIVIGKQSDSVLQTYEALGQV